MILIFDTSVEGFSIGLLDPAGQLIQQLNNDTPYAHSELLIPSIIELLQQCNIQFSDLTQIITTKGPGSFTGIRVGLATATGLQIALNIPVFAINTLIGFTCSWLLNAIDIPSIIHTVLDTKCRELYYQKYQFQNNMLVEDEEPSTITIDRLKRNVQEEKGIVITHTTTSTILNDIDHTVVQISSLGMWNAAKQAKTPDLQPLYVRSANVTHPL
jgi:tRNA threonylcarbamoyl adenosine modification protein YeaZ